MNTFDFYSIHVFADTKTELKRAGISTKGLDAKLSHFVTRGSKRYPRFTYWATVGFVDVPGAGNKPDEIAAVWKAKGLKTSIKYHVRD